MVYIFVVVTLIILVVIVSKSDLFSITVGQEESDGFIENVSMRITSPSWSIEYLDISTKNITVADFLFECASHYNFTVEKEYWKGYKSFFINAINNIKNGEDDRYWQYYVNGKFADVGCSIYFLQDNDVVEWRFELSRWL
jgi:hypothetical protein